MEENFLQIFNEITFEPEIKKRDVCERCGRPASVCLCQYLPSKPIELCKTTLHILQHPNEENRPLHTVAILKAALSPKSCLIYKGRRFQQSCNKIIEVSRLKNTFLLYPGVGAKDIDKVVSSPAKDTTYNILIIDGTWKQASSIYAQNKFLHGLQKVCLKPTKTSEYVIRTQPNDHSLSTVECVALALECTEARPDIKEILLKPLRRLCQFQLDHGASVHHSKEFIRNKENGS